VFRGDLRLRDSENQGVCRWVISKEDIAMVRNV
jgi:hypothetical protein